VLFFPCARIVYCLSLAKCEPSAVGVLIFVFLIISRMHVRLSSLCVNSEPVFAGSGNRSVSYFMYVSSTLCSQYICILLVIPVPGACVMCVSVSYAIPKEILTAGHIHPNS